MRNLHHPRHITESAAMGVMFDACRNNAQRATIDLGGVCVGFRRLANGREHEAEARDESGAIVARAIVDEFDI